MEAARGLAGQGGPYYRGCLGCSPHRWRNHLRGLVPLAAERYLRRGAGRAVTISLLRSRKLSEEEIIRRQDRLMGKPGVDEPKKMARSIP